MCMWDPHSQYILKEEYQQGYPGRGEEGRGPRWRMSIPAATVGVSQDPDDLGWVE